MALDHQAALARRFGRVPGWTRPFVRAWRRFLALTRLSPRAVCAESAAVGCYDYHNYRDDVDGAGWATTGGARCVRCGKRFRFP